MASICNSQSAAEARLNLDHCAQRFERQCTEIYDTMGSLDDQPGATALSSHQMRMTLFYLETCAVESGFLLARIAQHPLLQTKQPCLPLDHCWRITLARLTHVLQNIPVSSFLSSLAHLSLSADGVFVNGANLSYLRSLCHVISSGGKCSRES